MNIFDWIFGDLMPIAVISAAQGIETIMGYNYDAVNLIFSNDAIKELLVLFYSLGAGLYIGGAGLSFANWAIDSKEGNAETIMNTLKNVFVGFIAVNSFTSIPILLLKFTDFTTQTVTSNITNFGILDQAEKLIKGTLEFGSIWDSSGPFWYFIYVIIVFVAVVKVFFANIKRGGILVAQMGVGALHMFSVPRGYNDAFYSWCKQVAGLCLTAFLQNVFIVFGLLVISAAGSSSLPVLIASAGIVMAAAEVPRILQHFGLDTSIKASFTQAVYATSGVTSIIRSVVH
ncbi:MAG: conjugal transfer protein TrbL family protein [Ruminococcus sp.]